MKYTVNIDIDRPKDEVVSLFHNPEHYLKWMNGLQKHEIIKGEFGKVGTISKFQFKMGKREMIMEEEVLKSDLPNEHIVSYKAGKVCNEVCNRFEEISENQTRVYNDQAFQFKGFMKLMGWFMPGAFKKQSMKYLVDFKNFVEQEK
jgi:carbon monoxide dehydrogenase subunit G